MKLFMITFTEDFGDTVHTVLVNADTYTEAYMSVDMKLSKDGAITGMFEIV